MLSISFAVFIKSWLTFRLNHRVNRIVFDNMHEKQKASTIIRLSMLSILSGWLDSNQRPRAPQTLIIKVIIILIISVMPICPFLSVCTMVCTVQIGLVNIEFTTTKITITSVIFNFIIVKLSAWPSLISTIQLTIFSGIL